MMPPEAATAALLSALSLRFSESPRSERSHRLSLLLAVLVVLIGAVMLAGTLITASFRQPSTLRTLSSVSVFPAWHGPSDGSWSCASGTDYAFHEGTWASEQCCRRCC